MSRRGFTMVEMLGVIGIIAILAAILFPVFARARAQTRTHSCRVNLLNIGMALRLYATDYDGWYPPKEDDLSPLLAVYLPNEHVFQCPSAGHSQEIPMGAPADESIEIKPPREWSLPPLGPPYQPPPRPMGPPPPPGPPAKPPQEEGADAELICTSYYYRAGHRHNELPRVPLVADHEALHKQRANVLFSDGGIETLAESAWQDLGFRPIDDMLQERYP